jgi:hypothetical protein
MKRVMIVLMASALAGALALPAAADGEKRKIGGEKGREGMNNPAAMYMQMQIAVMRRFDRNRNNRLDPDEQRQLILAADRNFDGRVSPQEVMALVQGGEGGREGGKEGAKKQIKKKEK